MSVSDTRYVVVGSRPWSRRVFDDDIIRFPGEWSYIGAREELTLDHLSDRDPRYVFFLHWSWIVPEEILDAYECVVFHMTDVPYGRGGSPLQNLIVQGRRHTKLSAIRMTTEVDAGPVYGKRDLCLEGSAEEVYLRASRLAAEMIEEIITNTPEPRPQEGDVVEFKRRSPADSAVTDEIEDLDALHDFVRMLDANGYPKAFLDFGAFRFEFSRSCRYTDHVRADVVITQRGDEDTR